MLLRLLLAVACLAVVLPNARAAAQHHVLFGDQDWRDANETQPFHVYLDAAGNLYPGRAVRVHNARLKEYGTLQPYFRANQAAWDRLRAAAGVSTALPFETAWAVAQDSLRAHLARRINQQAYSEGKRWTVVFLVHGFRVDAAEAGFETIRNSIRVRYGDLPLLFVDVHWDGMFSNLGRELHLLPSTWNRANENAPLVGLQLRRIIEELKDDLPVRVITHSLGGSVLAAALWPRDDVKYRGSLYAEFPKQSRGADPFRFPPNSDFRVGMIVPAMRGAAFAAVPAASRPAGNYRLVVVGQNRYDPVVLGNYVALGQTDLAVSRTSYCQHVHRAYLPDPRATALRYDFSAVGRSNERASHDVSKYFVSSRISGFLDHLFSPGVSDADEARACAGKPRAR